MSADKLNATELLDLRKQSPLNRCSSHHLAFLAVLAAALNAAAVGAPLVPGLRIFSPDPSLIRSRFAWMLPYKLGFMSTPVATKSFPHYTKNFFEDMPIALGWV
jgi:hypothetical protein